jgi:DNA-binding MarR family transcriptional regulator
MKSDDVANAMDPASGLDQNLGFHIRLAHGAVYRHFVETFGYLDMTQKQVAVLWLIDEWPGIGQTDLAKRLQMDRATVMAMVDRLQARGFITREPSKKDRRKQILKLLAEGRTVLKKTRKAVNEHESWLKSRFTEKEVTLLTELLGRIYR